MPLKPLDTTKTVMGNQFNHEESQEQLLGQIWCKEKDTIRPSWNLNTSKKVRGKHLINNLTTDNLKTLKITRRNWSRLMAEQYDPQGLFVNHLSMGFKTILKKICHMFANTKSEMD